MVPPLLLCSVCIVAVRGRGPGEMTICDGTKQKVSAFKILSTFLICLLHETFMFAAKSWGLYQPSFISINDKQKQQIMGPV